MGLQACGPVAARGRGRYQRRSRRRHSTRGIGRRCPWKTVEQVEVASLEYVWWWNNQRLHSKLDYRTPAEVEAAYYAHVEPPEPAEASLGNR
jgi:transposase InsO family protein